jgi:hypothetical protein
MSSTKVTDCSLKNAILAETELRHDPKDVDQPEVTVVATILDTQPTLAVEVNPLVAEYWPVNTLRSTIIKWFEGMRNRFDNSSCFSNYYWICINRLSEYVQLIEPTKTCAVISAILWSTGALIILDCWLRNPPRFTAVLPALFSVVAAIVLNSVHPKEMRGSESSSRQFAVLLACAYICMFIPFAQIIWWTVEADAKSVTTSAMGCSLCCIDATGYFALFLASAASLMRFGALLPNSNSMSRSLHANCDECFDFVAPVGAALCMVISVLCHTLATLSTFGQSFAGLAVLPMIVQLPLAMILNSTRIYITDMESPIHAWSVFTATCSVPWSVAWPIVLFRADLLDTLQTVLVCCGNVSLVCVVWILTALAHNGFAPGSGYRGVNSLQFQY